nr:MULTISPECIES: NAD(P)-dependent alcohol dehydrogenase [unclassified Rhodococcus (in: high G+C Gram-positive bacteria)]
MPVAAFTRAPHRYSHAEAATLTTAGVTAWRALFTEGNLRPGETVLVQGTGGVSIFALQFAKLVGATVIATTSTANKEARLEQLGADHVINYRSTPEWGAEARAVTGGRGVDHVIEVGGAQTLEQSMIAAATGGRIALIGVLGGMGASVPLGLALARQVRIRALLVGSRRDQLDMIGALENSSLRPVVDTTFELADLAGAFEHQEAGRHLGKICITI